MHVNIVNEHEDMSIWHPKALKAKQEIFELTKSLNGMLSAEHGVGLLQKNYMPIFFNDIHLNILRCIKKVFDPKGILNPNKLF
jgi:glycolate oxidase